MGTPSIGHYPPFVLAAQTRHKVCRELDAVLSFARDNIEFDLP